MLAACRTPTVLWSGGLREEPWFLSSTCQVVLAKVKRVTFRGSINNVDKGREQVAKLD
jgi:hypothetical protein